MDRMTGILVAALICGAGCDLESARSTDGGERLATAGVPGSVSAEGSEEQDTMPLVARRVWAGSDVDDLGAPSPDGRHLTYVDWMSGDLAVRDLHAGASRHITEEGTWDGRVAWAENSVISPDGQRVAFTWVVEDPYRVQLRLVDLDGTDQRILVSDSMVGVYPREWSADGSQLLAWLDYEDGPRQMGLVSTADGSIRRLKALDWRNVVGMSLSPDGRYAVYDFPANQESTARDIYVVDTDDGREIPLVQHPANDIVFGWAPDGQHILFGSDRTGTQGAWLVAVEDGRAAGEPRLIKPDMWGAKPIGFARDGSFFYSVSTSDWDVYLATLDMEAGRELVAPVRVDERHIGGRLGSAWSRDGRYLAYGINRNPPGAPMRSLKIAIRSMDTGDVRELFPGLQRMSRFGWSPDGRYLVVPARDEHNAGRGLFRVDAQTAEYELLVAHDFERPAYYNHIGFAPDGQSLYYDVDYFGGDLPGEHRIIMRDLGTDVERVLYRAIAPTSIESPVALSPDGQTLAFALSEEEGALSLVTLPSNGGDPETVHRFEKLDRLADLVWNPDGESLIYNSLGGGSMLDGPRGLWRVPVKDGEPVRMELSTDGFSQVVGVQIHPDGRRITFSAGSHQAEIWVMSDFLPSY